MTITTIPVVVDGTGLAGRAAVIRAHCKEGAPVEVRRTLTNPKPDEALEVWLQCSHVFGLLKSWKKIGFVEGGRYGAIARQLNDGLLRVRKSTINSYFAPLDRDEPQVALELEVEWTPGRGSSSGNGPPLRQLIATRTPERLERRS